MKKLLLVFCGMLTMAVMSCTKDNDENLAPASQNEAQMREVSYSGDIHPFMRKSCSAAHCHGVTARPLEGSDLQSMLASGSFHERIFVLGASTPCGTMSDESLSMLKAWVASGAQMQ